jgi:hypothetical protein
VNKENVREAIDEAYRFILRAEKFVRSQNIPASRKVKFNDMSEN